MIALLFAAGTAIMVLAAGCGAAATSVAVEQTHRLVIDAGHGGLDGGAVSVRGDKESAVNLSIAQRLCDLCRLFGQDCVMTRSREDLDYPEAAESTREKKRWDLQRRVDTVNAADNAFLISIHQNLYPDARPFGAQVLYAKSAGSKEFAELAHENLRRTLCPENRRVAVPASDEIYILKHVLCPAILVECGFLSNPSEAEKLVDPVYQIKIAAVLGTTYLEYTAPVS